jgi:hypothetical protein
MNKLVIAAGIALAANYVHAQPAPPAATGLIVGSGMFYSPTIEVTPVQHRRPADRRGGHRARS